MREPSVRIVRERGGMKTPQELRDYATVLREKAAEMTALADKLDQTPAKSIRIDGNLKAVRGIELIEAFMDRIDTLIYAAKKKGKA